MRSWGRKNSSNELCYWLAFRCFIFKKYLSHLPMGNVWKLPLYARISKSFYTITLLLPLLLSWFLFVFDAFCHLVLFWWGGVLMGCVRETERKCVCVCVCDEGGGGGSWVARIAYPVFSTVVHKRHITTLNTSQLRWIVGNSWSWLMWGIITLIHTFSISF